MDITIIGIFFTRKIIKSWNMFNQILKELTTCQQTQLILLKYTELLTSEQAAAYLGISPGTLEFWRCTKRYHIPFIKVGRLVRYPKSELDSFLDKHIIWFLLKSVCVISYIIDTDKLEESYCLRRI